MSAPEFRWYVGSLCVRQRRDESKVSAPEIRSVVSLLSDTRSQESANSNPPARLAVNGGDYRFWHRSHSAIA